MPRRGYTTVTISVDAKIKFKTLQHILSQLLNTELTLSDTIDAALAVVKRCIQSGTQSVIKLGTQSDTQSSTQLCIQSDT